MWLLSLLLMHNPRVEPVDVSQMLTHGIIWAVNQDEVGFLWLGTSGGLFRYDGHQLKSYKRDPENPHGISDNMIRSILIDSQSRLWVGTSDGLNLMEGEGRFRAWRRDPEDPATLGGNYINVMVEGRNGRLWIGTRRGLSLFDPRTGTAVSYSAREGLSGNRVLALAVDQEGGLWIGSEGGLDRWDAKQNVITPQRSSLKRQVNAVLQDRDGRIWAAGAEGIAAFDSRSGMEMIRLTTLGDKVRTIETLVEGHGDFLWAGCRDGALVRIHRTSGAFEIYRDERPGNVLHRKDIVSMFIDHSRVLWMGTFLSGLYKADLKPDKFKPFPISDEVGVPLVEIQAAEMDDRGRLWVGSQRGLVRYDPTTKKVRHYQKGGSRASLSEDQILSLAADGNHMWIGTFTGGLNLLNMDSERLEIFKFKPGEGVLSSNVVLDIFKDRDGEIWLGTRGGLARFDRVGRRMALKPLQDGKDNLAGLNMVQEIQQDREGLLWLGADGYGLCRLDLQSDDFRWFRFDHRDPSSLAGNRVNVVHQTRDGRMWVGTHGGLSLWLPSREAFLNYGDDVGSGISLVTSILEGPRGELWLGTNNGILRFEPDGKGGPVVRRFDTSDGLAGNSFFRDVALPLKNGDLIFGGTKGLSRCSPHRMRFNTIEPTIALTSFKVFGVEVPATPGRPVVLSHHQNHFTLEFAALDFTAPHKNRYAYMVEGFDAGWNDGRDRGYAHYTNLPAGDYTLLIKGSNNDGVWNEEGVRIPMIITPPFYQTLWFRLMLIPIGLIPVWFFHRRGVMRAQAQNHDLEHLVAEKTEKLENARRKLLDLAHQSGIFEITHGVLDQISQQMEAVNHQVNRLNDALASSPMGRFDQVVIGLSKLEAGKTGESEVNDRVADLFEAESRIKSGWISLSNITEDLLHHINLMRDTITMQHEYSKMDLYTQEVSICSLVDDAVLLAGNQIRGEGVFVNKAYLARPKARLPKVKMVHVLAMIIQNSLEAMADSPEKMLILEVALWDDRIGIRVLDTGRGIGEEHRDQIFNYGFTTKPGHSGFGLHDCANALRELDGTIEVENRSDGPGASVTLSLPRDAFG